MFVFGHTVLGFKLAKKALKQNTRFFNRLSKNDWLLLLGTLLPDIIDKPLFYFFGEWFPAVTGTRTFGHVLWIPLLLLPFKQIRYLGIGMLTHLMLDHIPENIQNIFTGHEDYKYRWEGFFWPLMGNYFPIFPYDSMLAHGLGVLKRLPHLLGEGLGIALLIRDYFVFRSVRLTQSK